MDTGDIGAQLRSAREARGLSLASLAQRTRVQLRIIAAIENNDLASIPPKPYGRGFVRAYAREVGLDPDQTVRGYFAQFEPATASEDEPLYQPEPWPARTSWLMSAAGMIAVALVALAVIRGNPTDSTDRSTPPAVGTSGSTGEHPTEAPRPDATMGIAEPVADPRERSLSVVLLADRVCWVTASADGERILYQLMQPGTQQTIRADREVTLRAGDAGGLRLTVNGRETGAFGDDGQVRTMRITPETAARVGGETDR